MAGRGFLGLFRRRRDDELAQIDAEITAFGEAVSRFEFGGRACDEDVLADYGRALDAYERAKRDFVGDRDRADAEDVLRELDDGRHALACAQARLDGAPLPERHPLCFFDPRHGPSTTERRWTPPEGAPRLIPVCAADAVRLAETLPPIATGRETRQPRGGSVPEFRLLPRRGGAPAREFRLLPPKKAERGTSAPVAWRTYKSPPPGTAQDQRSEGRGDRKFKLHRPDPAAPALLVFRLHGGGRGHASVASPAGRRPVNEFGADRAVLPVPADGADRLDVTVETPGTWQIWVQSLEYVPVLEKALSFKGSYVFRYDGGPVGIRFANKSGGDYALTGLTDALKPGAPVLSGKGVAHVMAELPGPGHYHVQCRADWQLVLQG